MVDSESISGPMDLIPPCCSNKQRKSESNNLFINLSESEELLVEILLRLPTKSAVRLQVVCKRWYSLISSPYFIARFTHSRDVQSSLVYQISYYCRDTCESGDCRKLHSEFHIISDDCSLLRNVYGDDDGFNLSYLPCSPIDLDNFRLVASFADLILCSTGFIFRTKETNYYVSNLLTRQWIALPPLPATKEAFSIGFLCVLSSRSRYKFMAVRLCVDDPCIPCSRFKVQVFSSEGSQWRTLVVSSPLPLKHRYLITPLIAYRGMLHWLNPDCIVVYDPLNIPERFSCIIELPIQLPLDFRKLGITTCFGVSQGRLRVVEVSRDDAGYPVVDVWELQDYDSRLWNLVHKVYLTNLTYNGLPITEECFQSKLCPFFVLSMHPENGDVVYLLIGNGVALVNMKSRIMERYYLLRRKQRFLG